MSAAATKRFTKAPGAARLFGRHSFRRGGKPASAQGECVAKVDGTEAQGAVDDRPATTDRAANLPVNARTARDRAAKRLVSVDSVPRKSLRDRHPHPDRAVRERERDCSLAADRRAGIRKSIDLCETRRLRPSSDNSRADKEEACLRRPTGRDSR